MSSTNLMDEIKKALNYPDGKWNEKKGVWNILQPLLNVKPSSAKKEIDLFCQNENRRRARKWSNFQKCSLKQDQDFPAVETSIMV